MKAVRIHNFGPTEDVLQFEEVPTPEPGHGELLIKVEAASLNRADLGLRSGNYRIDPKDLPVIPGREFAGRVTKMGDGVSDLQVGQRVVAYTGTALPASGGVATAQGAARGRRRQPPRDRPLPTHRLPDRGRAAPPAPPGTGFRGRAHHGGLSGVTTVAINDDGRAKWRSAPVHVGDRHGVRVRA